MPIIDISLIEGRSTEQKSELIKQVTDAVERSLQVPRESIRIIIRDVPASNWGAAGLPKKPSA